MVRLLLTFPVMLKRLAAAGILSLLLLGLMATPAHSQALDPAAASALAATLRMLADPGQRGQIIATDPAAARADQPGPGAPGPAPARPPPPPPRRPRSTSRCRASPARPSRRRSTGSPPMSSRTWSATRAGIPSAWS